MVDADLILASELARQGIKFLMESGVLQTMQSRLLERLASGDSKESEEAMVLRVREYRLQKSFVDSLIDVGETVREEGESE